VLSGRPHAEGIGGIGRGITLIEVLVALVVFSVGLVGLATLQARTMGENRLTYLRSQAVLHGEAMLDRMRANPIGVDNGAYDNPGQTAAAAGVDSPACRATAGCNPLAMAANDLFEWANSVAQLPQGAGVVCVDATPDDGLPGAPACDGATVGGTALHTVKVFWEERGNQQRITTQSRPGL